MGFFLSPRSLLSAANLRNENDSKYKEKSLLKLHKKVLISKPIFKKETQLPMFPKKLLTRSLGKNKTRHFLLSKLRKTRRNQMYNRRQNHTSRKRFYGTSYEIRNSFAAQNSQHHYSAHPDKSRSLQHTVLDVL